jgi:hypothetical protein
VTILAHFFPFWFVAPIDNLAAGLPMSTHLHKVVLLQLEPQPEFCREQLAGLPDRRNLAQVGPVDLGPIQLIVFGTNLQAKLNLDTLPLVTFI